MKELRALVLLPFEESYSRLAEVIKLVLVKSGVVPVLPYDLNWSLTQPTLDTMTVAIQEADMIVADVSRNSPNIFLELGFALAFRKPIMVMMSIDYEGKIPSDLAGYMIITYDPENLLSLETKLYRFIQYQVERRSAMYA